VSLALGIITYFLLNHVYAWEVRHAAVLLLVAVPSVRSKIVGAPNRLGSDE
jgi:hypothetical protein